jgi:hypothetical protein
MMEQDGLRVSPGDMLRIILIPLRQFSEQIDLQIKYKAISVPGRPGPKCCETSRFPHYLDNPLRDVSLTNPPAALYRPGRFLVLTCVRLIDHKTTVRLEGFGQLKFQ